MVWNAIYSKNKKEVVSYRIHFVFFSRLRFRVVSGSTSRIASMMSSKVGSVALAPGRAFSTRRITSLSWGFGLGGTLPLSSMRPGVWWAEVEPSVTTSATRYDQPESIGVVPVVMPELKLVNVQRHIGRSSCGKCRRSRV